MKFKASPEQYKAAIAKMQCGFFFGVTKMLRCAMADPAIVVGGASVRMVDGLYSLNDLHRASGGSPNHRPGKFMRNEQIKARVAEILNSGIPAFKSKRGANSGIYACLELVIAYTSWIGGRFHFDVIRALLQGSTAPSMLAAHCLHGARFMLTFDEDTGQIMLREISKRACLIDPNIKSSLQTFISERVPIELLPVVQREAATRVNSCREMTEMLRNLEGKTAVRRQQ